MLAFSATYTEALLAQLRALMTSPQEVMLCPETVTLRGACSGACLHAVCEAAFAVCRCETSLPRGYMWCGSRMRFYRCLCATVHGCRN